MLDSDSANTAVWLVKAHLFHLFFVNRLLLVGICNCQKQMSFVLWLVVDNGVR